MHGHPIVREITECPCRRPAEAPESTPVQAERAVEVAGTGIPFRRLFTEGSFWDYPSFVFEGNVVPFVMEAALGAGQS